jgi:poly-gamma-glutamate capsule biosynthesis protein CapA/YwtB (metallophosphatase superfamily)
VTLNFEATALLRHVHHDEIPRSCDLWDADSLAGALDAAAEAPFDVIAVGDIMLGGRATKPIREHGSDYPFRAVAPLLERGRVVLGNLEGPLARHARRHDRNFSYRVDPELAHALKRAGIGVVTLANNHLVDCGRRGVTETLDALSAAGVARIGAGRSVEDAHAPWVVEHGGLRIGLLGYYWNRRCAAREDAPGSAMDPPEALESDITALKRHTDRIVVTFHWGIPYERVPQVEDRLKARAAIDLGADAVVGHHPHVVQPFEVYRGKPIFYSVGNFTFGSGNSRGEGLLLGFRFERDRTCVAVYPLYVKNRDPRVNYQPKALRGTGARRALEQLRSISGSNGRCLSIETDRGSMVLP